MNYNISGPSYQSYSTSSSSSDEDNYEQAFASSRNALCATIARNNSIIDQYLIEQQKQETHGGSIPGRIVINRDRENADRNLFNDYFAPNPRYGDTVFANDFEWVGIYFFVFSMLFVITTTFLSKKGMHMANSGCRVCKKQQLYFECWHMVYLQMLLMSILK